MIIPKISNYKFFSRKTFVQLYFLFKIVLEFNFISIFYSRNIFEFWIFIFENPSSSMTFKI